MTLPSCICVESLRVPIEPLSTSSSPAPAPALQDVARQIAAAEAARASGDLVAGLAAADSAWRAAAGADPALRLRAGMLLVHFHYASGHLSPMVDVAIEVLPLLRDAGPAAAVIDLLRQIALCAADGNRFDVSLAHAQEAYRCALALGDTARISMAINAIGCFFERAGDPWQAERLMLESLALARQQSEPHALFISLNNLGAVLIGKYYLLRDAMPLVAACEPLRAALPHAREAVAMAMQGEQPFARVFALGNLGEVLVHLGEAAAAADALGASMAQARAGGFSAQAWRIGCSVGELQLLQGLPAEAWDTLTGVLAASADAEPRITHLRLHHALWRAASQLGHSEDALNHLQHYLRLERQRAVTQLRAQSELFVTRVEAEQMRQDAQRHRARARQLEADVLRDDLTGLGNRRELERRWPELLRKGSGGGEPLSVAMLDLDHFKQVNDRHGHAIGDRVLVELAGLLRSHTRGADLIVRLGGEEFLLVLPDTAAERAFEVCDRLRQCVAAHPWAAAAPALAVTVSIGLCTAPPADAQTLMQRADAALYRAKAAGRNRLIQG